VFNKTPFMEVVGGNAGLTGGLVNQTLNAKASLEGARIEADTLKDIEKLRRPTVGDRLRAVLPGLMQGLQNSNPRRRAGESLGFNLSEAMVSPAEVLTSIGQIQDQLNGIRAGQAPWFAGSQAGARALMGKS
jgi:hypothetical protein